jgi:hypothetical protein
VPEVISAQRLFGATTSCVGAADLAVYQRIYDEHVGTLPGVHRLSSNLVMKEAVHDRGLPLTARYFAPEVDSDNHGGRDSWVASRALSWSVYRTCPCSPWLHDDEPGVGKSSRPAGR